MHLIIKFLRNCVFIKNKYTYFINLFSQMITHLSNSNLEKELKIRKMNKMYKMIKDLNTLQKLPIMSQLYGYIWLESRWYRRVIENGFISIDKTLFHLNKSIVYDDSVESYNFQNYFKRTIVPHNCQLSLNKNEKVSFNINIVRPSLPKLEGKLYGLCVEFIQTDFTLRIFGLCVADRMRLYRSFIDKSEIIKDLKERYSIEYEDCKDYLDTFSYRDYLIYETRQITNKIKQQIERVEYYKKQDMAILMSEYNFLDDYMRIELINLLLTANLIERARFLLSKGNISTEYIDWELLRKIDFFMIENMKQQAEPEVEEQVPYEMRISSMKTSDGNKAKAFEKLKAVNQSTDGAPKAQKYLDGILKIPFGNIKNEKGLDDPSKKLLTDFYKKFPECKDKGSNSFKVFKDLETNEKYSQVCQKNIEKIQQSRETQQKYLKQVEDILCKCVHGHDLVKTQIKRLLAQWITGGQSGIVLGLEGPPGNGKTTIIKKGLAKCLVDQDGKPRPVGFIPLGGSSSSSTLVGHGYTYQGSTWGRLVDILMECKCMNPIYLFDELDKVSNTEHGREVTSILTHLTDTTQNHEFYDKYFEGVKLDMSKSLMIFTFNDRSKIDPILLDRMTVIETKPLSLEDKKIVTRQHLIPQITSKMDLNPEEIDIDNEDIEDLIFDYTREAGARQLKKLLESLIQELNLRRLENPMITMSVDKFLINEVFSHRDKVRAESVCEDAIIGQINGMYANALGLGGILPIQVSSNIIDSKLVLTGTQGDTMQESMKCARTQAFHMLPEEIQKLQKNDDSSIGLHIHCPSTSTPKDGPSAGGAICVAIYSFLTKKPINQKASMTGEIDLKGRITAIGGVEAKLNGAKKAGIKVALLPKENSQQLERLRRENKSPEDENFKVVMVDHVKQALQYFF